MPYEPLPASVLLAVVDCLSISVKSDFLEINVSNEFVRLSIKRLDEENCAPLCRNRELTYFFMLWHDVGYTMDGYEAAADLYVATGQNP